MTFSGAANAFSTGAVAGVTSAKASVQAVVAMGGDAIGQLKDTGHISAREVISTGLATAASERLVPEGLLKKVPAIAQSAGRITKGIIGAVAAKILPGLPSSVLRLINRMQGGGGSAHADNSHADNGSCTMTGDRIGSCTRK
jgi:hypothetical protein